LIKQHLPHRELTFVYH